MILYANQVGNHDLSHEAPSEDANQDRIRTPRSLNREEDLNEGTQFVAKSYKALRLQPQDYEGTNDIYLKPPIDSTHWKLQNEVHEIDLSNNSNPDDVEPKARDEYLPPTKSEEAKPQPLQPRNKLTASAIERTTPQKTRSKSKTHSGGSNQKSWSSRLSKEAVLTKANSSRTQTSVQDITSTYKKNRRDPQSLAKIESQLSGSKTKTALDNSTDQKMEERLREFKILKESFLKSVFTKAKQEPAKQPPKNNSHHVKFANSSFEERSTAARKDESPLREIHK
jgi:hypothetical protein